MSSVYIELSTRAADGKLPEQPKSIEEVTLNELSLARTDVLRDRMTLKAIQLIFQRDLSYEIALISIVVIVLLIFPWTFLSIDLFTYYRRHRSDKKTARVGRLLRCAPNSQAVYPRKLLTWIYRG
jgi:hypothetical protein